MNIITFILAQALTMEHLWDARRTNAFTSVAFWYQDHPLQQRPGLPGGSANHARSHADSRQYPAPSGLFDVPGLEVPLRRMGVNARPMLFFGQQNLSAGGGIRIDPRGQEVRLPLSVPEDGHYRVELKPVYGLIDKVMRIALAGNQPVELHQHIFERENDGPLVNLGEAQSQGKVLTLVIPPGTPTPIHIIKLIRLKP